MKNLVVGEIVTYSTPRATASHSFTDILQAHQTVHRKIKDILCRNSVLKCCVGALFQLFQTKFKPRESLIKAKECFIRVTCRYFRDREVREQD